MKLYEAQYIERASGKSIRVGGIEAVDYSAARRVGWEMLAEQQGGNVGDAIRRFNVINLKVVNGKGRIDL